MTTKRRLISLPQQPSRPLPRNPEGLVSLSIPQAISKNNNVVLLSDVWVWLSNKVPKGFENFFRKGQPKSNLKKNGNKSNSKKTNSKKTNSENNNNNNDSSNNSNGLLAASVLLAGVATLSWALESSNQRSGPEITYAEFRNRYLETGRVERLVVVNKQIARVYISSGKKTKQHSGDMTPTITDDDDEQAVARNNGTSSSSSSSSLSTSSSTSSSSSPWEDSTFVKLDEKSSRSSNSSRPVPLRRSNSNPLRQKHDVESHVYHFNIGSVESLEEKLTKAQQGKHPSQWVPVQYIDEVHLGVELIRSIPFLLFLGMLHMLYRGMLRGAGGGGGSSRNGGGGFSSIFQVGRSNAKKINKEDINVTFDDVAGCQQAKVEVMEFVEFLQDSERFTNLGAKIPKGALLCGPPGTGKTLLAKAVAGEAGVPFYSISGSDFIEMFVGVGPARVRDMFREARANAPCIVFIDEIDAVGRQRGRGGFSGGGNDERENTLNQLLVEMDGFTPTTNIVVLAGTNRADILDQALTRPGRFDRQILVDKPDLQGRKEIFKVHLQGITLQEDEMDVYAGRLAGLTPGFAGADIANLCNEAAIVAARRKADAVAMEDFEKATDRVIGGLESNKIMSDYEKKLVAHHEAGHAVAGWFLKHADPLLKVTIIPRSSGALGFAQYLPKEVFLRTQEQIMDLVCMALAGRAAEQVFFDNVTTGASDDLKRVTQLVYSTIQIYGMNSRVGQLAFPQDSQNQGLPNAKKYSDATAEAMDEEARAIVDAAYQRTLDLITEKKQQVEQVAKLLLDKETITHDDLIDLIGERPFEGDSQYKEYVSQRHMRQASADAAAAQAAEEAEQQDGDNDDTNNKKDHGFDENSGLSPGLA